jgi:hypothetical protein
VILYLSIPCDVYIFPCLGLTMYKSVRGRERETERWGREREREGEKGRQRGGVERERERERRVSERKGGYIGKGGRDR